MWIDDDILDAAIDDLATRLQEARNGCEGKGASIHLMMSVGEATAYAYALSQLIRLKQGG